MEWSAGARKGGGSADSHGGCLPGKRAPTTSAEQRTLLALVEVVGLEGCVVVVLLLLLLVKAALALQVW